MPELVCPTNDTKGEDGSNRGQQNFGGRLADGRKATDVASSGSLAAAVGANLYGHTHV